MINKDFWFLRFLKVRMGRVHTGYFDIDFLRIRMGRVCMRYLIENFFLRDFLRVHMGRVRMGYLIEIFLRDFLRVHMGRVRSWDIFDRKLFSRFSKSSYGKGSYRISDRKFFFDRFSKIRIGYF